MNTATVITEYFSRGYKYKEIQMMLDKRHGYQISLIHLQRIISKLGLVRRGHHANLPQVVDFISKELISSGRQHGYRYMYMKCLNAGLRIPQKVVADIISMLDPEGVDMRKRRRLVRRRYNAYGPNKVWHIDSYDKLKPYGICINACIDGFSRKIIWAEAYHTNSDPTIIATWYLNAITITGGCPQKIRVDAGTENTVIVKLQEFLCDDDRCAIVGVSTANVRIEGWWGQYRKSNAEYYISLFGMMLHEGQFTGDFIDKELMRFCFLQIIQMELTKFVSLWNDHLIRPSHNEAIPTGRPSYLYECPEAFNTQDYLHPVDNDYIDAIHDLHVCKAVSEYPCDEDVFDVCVMTMEECDVRPPNNSEEAIIMYNTLRPIVRDLLMNNYAF